MHRVSSDQNAPKGSIRVLVFYLQVRGLEDPQSFYDCSSAVQSITFEARGETPTFIVAAMSIQSHNELRLAMQSIPWHEQHELAEALLLVPDLVEQESSPTVFLANAATPEVAARNLATYWRIRKRIFSTSWYRPMTMEGALNDSLDALLAGPVCVIPKNEQLVVFQDQRLNLPAVELHRIWFYVLQIAMRNGQDVSILSLGDTIDGLMDSLPVASSSHWFFILSSA